MATSGPKEIVPPEPPATLSNLDLPLSTVHNTWFRLCHARHPTPLFWSRLGLYRFDSPTARWGVCYSAESIPSAFQEVFGDKVRNGTPLDWTEIDPLDVWRIITPADLRGINLFGGTLSVIDATLQCFVSNYPLSQRWGEALMNHPVALEGLVYLGRQCGQHCLAMFGDKDSPRPYQNQVRVTRLGSLEFWDEFWPMVDGLRVRIVGMPKRPSPTSEWSLR